MTHAIAPLEPTLPAAPHDPRGLGGLLALVDNAKKPLPLTSVRVRASIAGPVCRTVVEQAFANPYDRPLEVVHIFPLPDEGAVSEVELVAGDVVVRAECRERKEAERTFAEAREAGKRAALLTAEAADVHTLRATNIPPGETVTVRIVVVEVLQVVDGRWRWRFPTTIAPRYLVGAPIGHSGPGVLPDTDQVPDASRLQPPLRLEGGTTLDLEVALAGPITALESALHATSLALDGGGVRIAPSGTATLDRDFVLAFATGGAEAVEARGWTDGAHTVVAIEAPTAAFPDPLPRDAVFVVDISGSMRGRKMAAAKLALKTALHGLDAGDRFRLIAFDDRLEVATPDLVPVDAANITAADRWIDALASRGGTVMAPALQAALAGDRPAGRLRTVLFVTDGQAHDGAALTALVAGRRNGARLFTLGIDTAVNSALLRRLARVGGGTCELATPRDDIEAKVASIEARFGSPLLTGVTAPGTARQEPAAVFTGRPAMLLVEGAGPVTVSATSPTGPQTFTVTPQRVASPLGPAWARARVAALEDRLITRPFEEEAIRPEVLRIALAHGIASRWTAFVAVEHTRTVDGERVEVVQPAELPADWDPAFLQQAGPPRGGGGPRAVAMSPRRARSGPPAPGKAKRVRRRASPPPAEESVEMFAVADEDDDLEAVALSADLGAPPPAGRPAPQASAPPPAAPRPRRKSLGDRILSAFRGAAPTGARQEAPSAKAANASPEAQLASTQQVDGSFGGDPLRTAAALLALVLLGHTRRRGDRSRTVRKAAKWLAGQAGPEVQAALDALTAAEAGQTPTPTDAWTALHGAGPEGSILAAVRATL